MMLPAGGTVVVWSVCDCCCSPWEDHKLVCPAMLDVGVNGYCRSMSSNQAAFLVDECW